MPALQLPRPRRIAAVTVPWRLLAVGALLLAVLFVGWAERIDAATEPRNALSADERSYVRLAENLQRTGEYGDIMLREPFHWAPGTPALLAFATKDDTARIGSTRFGATPARTAQAVVSTATIAVVFALAALLGGAVAGLVAALALAVYPPAITMAGGFLAEPLGGLGLALAGLGLAWAWRGAPWRFALAGLALGGACLARADTLPALVVLPLAVVALTWRAHRWHGALLRGTVLAVSAVAAVTPWVLHASEEAGHFVPITDGGGSTLYIATSLEGKGSVVGTKRALHAEACRLHASICDRSPLSVRAEFLLDAVAARHPTLTRDEAMNEEARKNLSEALDRPGAYAVLLASKFERLWAGYFRGRNVPVDPGTLWYHRALVLLAFVGLVAGAWRARSGPLAAVLVALLACTALNVVFVAEARHNARMLPVLVAAGTAGAAVALRRRPAPGVVSPSPPAARSAA